jgi:hypothetical protein
MTKKLVGPRAPLHGARWHAGAADERGAADDSGGNCTARDARSFADKTTFYALIAGQPSLEVGESPRYDPYGASLLDAVE